MDQVLFDKLKLTSFDQIGLVGPAKDKQTAFDGFAMTADPQGPLDLALAYVYDLDQMKDLLLTLFQNQAVRLSGQVYLIYPKQGNRLGHALIHRDAIFPYLEVDDQDGYIKWTDYRFNRMLALDANYTLVAVKHEPREVYKPKKGPSGRVADYAARIPDLEAYLVAYPDQLAFYQGLTPGYQRDWARQVYSAKTEATIQKRLEEMVTILGQGYKTKQLFREGKAKSS